MENLPQQPLSQINIPVFVSWKEAQKIAKEYFIGMKVDQGQLNVTVLDIAIREQNGKVFLSLETEGTYDGDIIVTTRPVFKKDKNKIDFEDLDLKMETSNFFQKGMVVLLRRTIEKQLEKMLDITLDQPIDQLLTMVNMQLKGFLAAPMVKITGKINEIDLLEMTYEAKGLFLQVAAHGHIQFYVDTFEQSELA